jgi:SpoVK/Ycf46/Vps4 family AAA+-type ATPase
MPHRLDPIPLRGYLRRHHTGRTLPKIRLRTHTLLGYFIGNALLNQNIQIELPLPDQTAHEKIFQVHLRDRPLAKDVTACWLAEQNDGFSGAEIEGVCHRSMMAALAARIEAAPEQPDAAGLEIQKQQLQTAIEELSPRTARVEHE